MTRMAPHYCPYCADQDLRPDESSGTAWECRGCLRVFSLSLVGIAAPGASSTAAATGAATGTSTDTENEVLA
jgi:ribosomal protein L37AE/L43A